MKAAPLCPRCGAPLPATALGGFCPRCVGRGVLGAEPAVQAPGREEKANVAEGPSDPESLSSGDDIKLNFEVEPWGEMFGQKIGRYKLLEVIGDRSSFCVCLTLCDYRSACPCRRRSPGE